MNGRLNRRARLRPTVLAWSMALLPLVAGCEPASPDLARDFLLDFVRGAVAAWLL